ncbi:MAG: alpha/beta hydrolase [Balneola sp.]
MKINGISGLGADKRVFDFLNLDYPLIPVEWIEPIENETLKDYSIRLSKIIDTHSDFTLVGLSFGGLVAVEISKILEPRLTILISSAETKNELRPIYRSVGKTGLLNSLPDKLFDPQRNIAKFIFGASNKILLNSILDDTDLSFAKWAVNELVNWSNLDRVKNIVRIHGTNDKLIPWSGSGKVELIENGEHFMIVDRANEISEIINEKIKAYSSNDHKNID